MTLLGDRRPWGAHPSWSQVGRFASGGFVFQAAAAWLVWLLVDDGPGPSWSNTDFREWVLLSLACAGCLTALAGAVVRRPQVTWAVAIGCLLATALGVAVFVAYAVVNSA